MEVTPCSAGDPPLQLPRYPEHSGLWKISWLALSPTPTICCRHSPEQVCGRPQASVVPNRKMEGSHLPLSSRGYGED